MITEKIASDALQPKELIAVYEISRVILQSEDTESALRQIIRLTRPVFIFDNAVLYHIRDGQALEPVYARAIGRGRSVEADTPWGESIARDVFQKADSVIHREELEGVYKDRTLDRMRLRDYLGLPMQVGGELIGALVFIRFGGPPYTPDQINLANFIAELIAQLLEREHLVERIANLEAERRLALLQENFIAMVTHDLRSPLGFIKGYATTLLREDVDWTSETSREFLMIIDDEADRLVELIDNLLDSSRLQTGSLEMKAQPVRLDTVLKDMVQRIKMSGFESQIQLNIEPSKSTVWADPTRLVQVFDNLISNAARYAPGSPVTISLDWEPGRAHITVEDEGPGIPAEHLEDIFKRFFRLPKQNAAVRGSGLGLFICREILAAHKGEILAESVLGEGTIFHIYLPLERSLNETHSSSQEAVK